jgi:hypothetical protein
MDTNNALLYMMVSQKIGNSSSLDSIDQPFVPSRKDVQINVLYFLSLTLALSVSFVCILGKQWIREYERDTPGSSSDAVRVRQARFDALQAWKLPQILSSLPVILQAALLLFFAGLLVQLWNVRDHTTAGVVSATVGLTLLFVIVTTVVPAHWSGKKRHEKFTPFRSPQAWIYYLAVYRQIHPIHGIFCFLIRRWWGYIRLPQMLGQTHRDISHRIHLVFSNFGTFLGQCWSWALSYFEVDSMPQRGPAVVQSQWAMLDIAFLKEENASYRWNSKEVSSVHRALRWVFEVFRNSSEMEKSLFWCLQHQNHPPIWRLNAAKLTQYVLSGNALVREPDSDDVDHIRYNLSCAIGISDIQSARGRFQIELIIRSSNQILDELAECGFRDVDLCQRFSQSCAGLTIRFGRELPTKEMQQCESLACSLPIQ